MGHDACRVEDVAFYRVGYRTEYAVGSAPECVELHAGIFLLIGTVGGCEVRENRRDVQRGVLFQSRDECREFVFGEADAVHARVEFYVNLEVGDTGFGGFGGEFLQFVQREDRRLEPIAEKCGVVGCDGVEHHYWHRDASATQLNTFVNDGHSQICRALRLRVLEIRARRCRRPRP